MDTIKVKINGESAAVIGGSFSDMLKVIKSIKTAQFDPNIKTWIVNGEDADALAKKIAKKGFQIVDANGLDLAKREEKRAADAARDAAYQARKAAWQEQDRKEREARKAAQAAREAAWAAETAAGKIARHERTPISPRQIQYIRSLETDRGIAPADLTGWTMAKASSYINQLKEGVFDYLDEREISNPGEVY